VTEHRQAGSVGVRIVVGNICELREVIALVESGRLTPIPLEFWPLDKINEVSDRVKRGEVAGRAVLTP
jgi:alcohol dehydrogenase, propanol-preferring